MNNQTVSRQTLLYAVKMIQQWHDFHEYPRNPESVFHHYYDNSPEMKRIRDVLGPYEAIKDEVISATSISVKWEK